MPPSHAPHPSLLNAQQQQQHHEDWRLLQEEMLRQYLATAETDLKAKQELVDIKQQRLHLAQDELSALSVLSASTTSRESKRLL